MNNLRMKKAVAAGLIGLAALSATAIAPSIADAQEAPTEEARETRRANREARRAERLAVLTDVLGVDAEALGAARDAGQSLADLATAQGVPVQDVVDAIVEAKTAQIQAKVAAGDLSQDEADERIAGLSERVAERVEATPGERGDGERGRRGFRDGPRGGAADAPAGA